MDLERIYREYFTIVYCYILSLSKDATVAEDITQETFFRAISTEREFRGESESYTWLCAIAKNLFIDEKRRKSRFEDAPLDEQPDEKKSFEKSLMDADTSIRIHRILHGMEEPYKEVFQLRVFGELSFKEIGSIFGKTETWARVTFHRARLMIKERMDES